MDLPVEVRLNIYADVSDFPGKLRSLGRTGKGKYTKVFNVGIIMVNKKFYQEAQPVLYRLNEIHFDCRSKLVYGCLQEFPNPYIRPSAGSSTPSHTSNDQP